jgi:hypothetical protein
MLKTRREVSVLVKNQAKNMLAASNKAAIEGNHKSEPPTL